MCLVWYRNLDFKQMSWVILIKVVLWKARRHTDLLGCVRHTGVGFIIRLFLSDTQAAPKGTILSALSAKYLGTSR